jgi:hypothetical protein
MSIPTWTAHMHTIHPEFGTGHRSRHSPVAAPINSVPGWSDGPAHRR